MANTIKIKRGLSTDLNNASLQQGELAMTTDTYNLYMGVGSGNYIKIGGGPKNISDGKARYSVRTINSARESNAYKLGECAFAEGKYTKASGEGSHAEGDSTTASEWGSHAEGYKTTANGQFSHAEGYGTIASSGYQHVQGKYNIEDTINNAHIVGNGLSDSSRSNAHTIDWHGNAWFAGDVYVKSTSGTNKDSGSKKLATEEYVTNLVGDVETILTTLTTGSGV